MLGDVVEACLPEIDEVECLHPERAQVTFDQRRQSIRPGQPALGRPDLGRDDEILGYGASARRMASFAHWSSSNERVCPPSAYVG